MKRSVRIFLFGVVVIAAIATTWWFSRPKEQAYAGKPLSFWFDLLANTGPSNDPGPAWQDLQDNQLTVLIKALQERETVPQACLRKFRGRHGRSIPRFILARLPNTRDVATMQLTALLLLDTMREEAKPAIPVLIKTLQTNPSAAVRTVSVGRLAHIGLGNKDVSQALLKAAQSDADANVRRNAESVLKRIDPEAAKHLAK